MNIAKGKWKDHVLIFHSEIFKKRKTRDYC